MIGDRSPLVAYLKVTQRCNLDCEYCPWHTSAGNFAGELSTSHWRRVIAQLASEGVRVFVLEGGEPTLRHDLPDLLNAVAGSGSISILATNAITPPWRFAASAFTVSVDGPREVHDQVRGKGSYDRLQRSLATRDDRSVVAIVVVSRRNRHCLRETVEGVASSVDAVLFTFEYPYKGVITNVLSPRDLAETKTDILRLKDDFNILNPSSRLIADPGVLPCHDWLAISVDHAGTIRAGCFVQHVEPKRCDECELGCFQVISSFYEFQLEAWLQFSNLLLRRKTGERERRLSSDLNCNS
ncbi:MAG TPA: radical SAM protein [Thermoanaerobaculia bacterium]|nr:radical SAM protein [Thermoanaerobaculia bacterium]